METGAPASLVIATGRLRVGLRRMWYAYARQGTCRMRGLRLEGDVTDAIDDLRATADDLAADATRLRDIERQKATMAPDDPALVPLAAEAERLSQAMAAKASAEHELAREVADDEGGSA